MTLRAQLGWGMKVRIVAICFLAQNCAMGLAFGSYGVLLASTESHFGVSRTIAASGMSMVTLAMGLVSPIAGTIMQRVPVSIAMVAAATISAIAYGVLTFTGNFPVALAMYGLVGVGVVVLALLGPVTIISRWFPTSRAQVLGIVNLPFVLFLAPFTIAEALLAFGRTAVIAGIAATFIALIPILALLVERPPPSLEPAITAGSPKPKSQEMISPGQILRMPTFWLLSLAVGVMSGSGSAFVVHIIPFATEKSGSLQFASSALSIYSGAGFLGILLFSWLSERIGAAVTLTVIAFGLAITWFCLIHAAGPGLILLAALAGLCLNAVVTLHGTALGDMFGTENVGKSMGYSYAIKVPFLFGFAPAFGFIYDTAGNYTTAFLTTSLLLVAAGILTYFLCILLRTRKLLVPS